MIWRQHITPDPNPSLPCIDDNFTETWIFNPGNPAQLIKITQAIDSDIFCSGHSFDSEGRLIVAGGFFGPGGIPARTYRFDPTNLPIEISVGGQPFVRFAPWSRLDDMAIRRYYPTILPLISESVPAGSMAYGGGGQLVIGGPTLTSGLDGNELWELHPSSTSSWLGPVAPPLAAMHPNHLENYSSSSIERYSLHPPTNPPTALLDSYPRAFQLQSAGLGIARGQIVIAGDIDAVPGSPALGQTLNGDAWVIVPRYAGGPPGWQFWRYPDSSQNRQYGTAVRIDQLPLVGTPRRNRVLVFGGAGTGGALNTVQELTAGSDPISRTPASAWNSGKAPMQYGRYWPNAVLLPTGKVLLVGGRQTPGQSAFIPELYDPGDLPQDSGFSIPLVQANPVQGFGLPTPRHYHSFALLLQDGRVLVAGGERPQSPPVPSEYSAEMYVPAYLYQPFRPLIQAWPTTPIGFGPATFQVTAKPMLGTIDRVVIMRPGSVTHHFDSDQRYIELAFTPQQSPPVPGQKTILTATAPDPDLAPPGHYMLFVIEADPGNPQNRVPSVAQFVEFQ
ncbi:MAG: DUF1929 domain-containing protein [Planctomycetes bacterium]|nr:DUF1929 domain-containing protein [Planctomycetota bacterium]